MHFCLFMCCFRCHKGKPTNGGYCCRAESDRDHFCMFSTKFAVIPCPINPHQPKKCSVRMKSSDGHWREVSCWFDAFLCYSLPNIFHCFLRPFVQWTDSLQDVRELLNLLKSNKLWNRRFACSTIWSLGRTKTFLLCPFILSYLSCSKVANFSPQIFAARPGIVARDLIRDLNGIPLLVSLIDAPSSDDELKRLAAGCVWSICKQSPSNCHIVLECGGVDSICTLLERGNDEQKCEAIGALRNLGGFSTIIAQRIVQCRGLHMLKECMRQDRNAKIREWSARAIKEIMWP
jgi:hypothetical protein